MMRYCTVFIYDTTTWCDSAGVGAGLLCCQFKPQVVDIFSAAARQEYSTFDFTSGRDLAVSGSSRDRTVH